nr:glycerate kinase [uncultured Actinotalea sp.]
MRILVAPDRFATTLTPAQAAEAMATGWSAGAPHDAVVRLPLSDGGPGFLEAVRAARGGELVPVTVEGPSGRPAPAPVLVVDGPGGRTAYLEAAVVLGAFLLPADAGAPGSDAAASGGGHRRRADVTTTSSLGLGRLLEAALDQGARRVVVAVGGAVTHDGGAGLLAGLGLDSPALRGGGAGLSALGAADLAGLADLRRRLATVDLVAAVDTDLQLLGLHGASAALGSSRVVSQEQAQELEGALSGFARLVGDVVAADDVRRDLLAPAGDGREQTRRLAQLPGSGAGGGLGFTLAALGARLRAGSRVAADEVGLQEAVEAADLVVTGSHELDGHALHDGVVATVAAAALPHAVPVVAVAGQVHVGRREWGAAGLAGVYAVAERPGETPPTGPADAAAALQARLVRVARTWSR